MKFYVIYDFDVPGDLSVNSCSPPFRSRNFRLTENHESEIFDKPTKDYRTGRMLKGKHRKYAGILTRKQFDALCDDQGLFMENIETMGSITDIGWLPAMSFRSESYDCYQNAYVTPLIERHDRPCDERDWDRVRAAMLRVYN